MSNELSTKTYNNFKNIVLNESPLIDVRAPIEFQKGAFINAVNLPLMSDDERHRVGTVYKKNGHEAAVALGHELVTGAVRAERINAWTHYMAHYPDAMLYCFRGGLRSELSQEWLSEALGRDVLRLEGGYKAFRQYLLEALEPSAQTSEPIMLGGHTGSGKTILLKRFKSFIDLEGIANHRGSSFGNHITPQPSQISFDNNLAYGLIQHREAGYRYMLLENEDRNVGRCFMPRPLVDHFNTGRLIILEESLETRTQITKLEYVREAQEEHMQALGLDDGMTSWANYIRGSINRLEKRLGGSRLHELQALFESAFDLQIKTETMDGHDAWIRFLLVEYYDPLYAYHMGKNEERIVYRGNTKDVRDYLQQFNQ